MDTLIANKTIDGKELSFVLLEIGFSDGDEPYTLFTFTDYYSISRAERNREFFESVEQAIVYCEQTYGICKDAWDDNKRFMQDFQFEYAVTTFGTPQPYLLDFEKGQIVFQFSTGINNTRQRLNVSGDREGLRRLAAMLLICAEAEQYDKFFHIHLGDETDIILPENMSVTLRNPAYLDSLIQDEFADGVSIAEEM